LNRPLKINRCFTFYHGDSGIQLRYSKEFIKKSKKTEAL
jgi:hypothetical protein